jgi:hypothetical protein
MSITITQDYDNYAACIGSGQKVFIYSTNFNQPNFYVSLQVTDGLGFNRTYYLYPDLLIIGAILIWTAVDSFFKAPFLLNNYGFG